jgi:hypothetical protein
MTTNVTTPVLYALGTVTTGLSFLAIGAALMTMATLRRAATVRPSGSTPLADQTDSQAQIPPVRQ